MSPIKPSHSNDAQPQQPQRRQLLAAAATLGVAPWLLSACASAATSPASDIGRPLSARVDSRRRLRSAEEDDDAGASSGGRGEVSMAEG